jgi:glutaredoxin
MASVKLHRCPFTFIHNDMDHCWKVQKALDDQGIEYQIVKGPWPRRKTRAAVIEGTGQTSYPAIQFENGTWYREQSKDMAQTIRDGKLMEKQGAGA